MAEPLTLRAVIYESHGGLVAQCLESDLCTSAADREELVRKLTAQVRLQIILDLSRGLQPLSSLPKAPQKFWDMYSASSTHEVLSIRQSWLGLLLRARRWRSGVQAKLALAAA